MQTTQCNNYHISERTATKVNVYMLPRFLEPCPGVAHCCAIFLCYLGSDHHRNPNSNDRDHLVGQLTSPGVDLSAKIAISWQLWFSGTSSSPMSSGTGIVSLIDSSLVLPSRMWWVVVLVTLVMVLVVIFCGDPNFGDDPFLMMLRAARMWCMVTFHQKPFSKAKKAFLIFFC